MGLVTIGQVLLAADRELSSTYRDVQRILKEETSTSRTSFDVFLSHSKMDEKYVLGAKRILEEKGFTVYVDWINDSLLDRSYVNKRTADYLRTRMKQCRLMFYLHTENASLSKWCPWELGFFDGHSGPLERTFVFPIVSSGESFKGQEYLELYPIVDIDNVGQTSAIRKDVWGHFPFADRKWRQMSSILEQTR
ncbi:MAG: toll-Interleukin receptor [Rhizobiales bacterium]|nr:toll-Interleukin receptor [Hyphomicrobiales bacterium]|tara:strand:+ start:499 stop:1077 length:579 start_codon:yes stop_codon:yes gene_type:complete